MKPPAQLIEERLAGRSLGEASDSKAMAKELKAHIKVAKDALNKAFKLAKKLGSSDEYESLESDVATAREALDDIDI